MGRALKGDGRSRHTQRRAVVLTGLVGTALICAALAYGRMQLIEVHHQVVEGQAHIAAPMGMLNDIQLEFDEAQRSFAAGNSAPSSAETGAAYSQALSQSALAEQLWARFDAMPAQFDGEVALRGDINEAIVVNTEIAEQLGVLILSTAPEQSQVEELTLAQIESSVALQGLVERLETDLYLPAYRDASARVIDRSNRGARGLTSALILAVTLGGLLTVLGYRRASQIERVERLEHVRQEMAASDNALDTQLQHALEMVDHEDGVLSLVGRALAHEGMHSVDVLLADSGDAPFHHAVTPDDESFGRCPVVSPNECPATKHGQKLVMLDSSALDVCPHLIERDAVPASAVCVPVSIAGHAVGVVHEAHHHIGVASTDRIRALEIIARKAGERLGMIRAFSQSESQAHTDPLTGLLNRRSLEDAVEKLQLGGVDYSLAFADLDHFKVLNDTFGHDVGDKALRLFCTVLRTNVRPDDIVARYGGEEFVVILPNCTPDEAVPVLLRVQQSLADVVRLDDVPAFTVSIGVASSHRGGSFEEILQMADGSLLRAKDQGRNRIVVAGAAEAHLGPVPKVDSGDLT